MQGNPMSAPGGELSGEYWRVSGESQSGIRPTNSWNKFGDCTTMWCMAKTEVYSWRLDRNVKMGLEEQARRKGMTLAEFLDRTALHLIEEGRRKHDDDAEQERLHAGAAKCFGTLSGGGPNDSENVRALVRKNLKEKYGR